MNALGRWRRLSPAGRTLVGVAAALVAVELLLVGVNTLSGGSGPGGPASSSYATQPEGLAGYAELLARAGHPVARLRESLDEADLRPDATLVVAGTGLRPDEVAAVGRFLAAGGRLVAAGGEMAPVLRQLLGERVLWHPGGDRTAVATVPGHPDLGPALVVRGAGQGRWESTGPALPLLASDAGTLAAVDGGVVLVADPSVLQNRRLAAADNAAFALAAAGPVARPVQFAEAGHGYQRGSGWAALSLGWRTALLGLLAATLVWMWSRSRRLGPPADDDIEFPPARRVYVDALASTLARTIDAPTALEPLRLEARRRIARRAGLGPDAPEAEVGTAGSALGLDAATLEVLARPVTTEEDGMRVARALAGLERP